MRCIPVSVKSVPSGNNRLLFIAALAAVSILTIVAATLASRLLTEARKDECLTLNQEPNDIDKRYDTVNLAADFACLHA